MLKVADLVLIVEAFSKDAHWDYRFVKFAKDTQELQAQSEDFDIKDEELFNQFESFMSAYKDLSDILSVSSESLDPESFEDAGQLIDTLKKRYERIMNNPYLNLDDGWDEDFDPGTFTQFLSDVATDAENKLKAAAGEDVDISEMRAAQYANQFNASNFEQTGVEGDTNLRWTGDKVQQGLEAKKRYFEKLMSLKKLNINHPEYQNYIQTRRRNYQSIISDPSRKADYRTKAKERQAKYLRKFTVRKAEIEKSLQMPLPAGRKKELEDELALINSQLENFRSNKAKSDKKRMDTIIKRKDSLETDDLNKLVATLMGNIANVKMGIKKNVTAKLRGNESAFKPYLDKIAAAKTANDEAGVLAATKALQNVLNKAAESDESLVSYNESSAPYLEFRDMLKVVSAQNWLDPNTSVEEVKAPLQSIMEKGTSILGNGRNAVTFKSPNKTLLAILTLIDKRLKKG